MLQIAGMKLETDNAPPVQRHSAPTAASGNPEGPVQKLVSAALCQSAPAVKVTSQLLSHFLALIIFSFDITRKSRLCCISCMTHMRSHWLT